MTRYLPVLFLLACPLMMIFMMRGGHGGHGGHGTPHDMGADSDSRDERIATLEREVTQLRGAPHVGSDRQEARRE